jgi:dihydroorotate dehydrogenase (fumarate)
MVELHTRYLGLDLRTPLVASASPLTGSLDGLRRLEAAGAAAVVLPSLFEEQLTLEADQVGRLLEGGADSLSAALALEDYNAGPYGYLALVEKARASLQVPVIASLNGVTPGAWVEHASLLEEAGADALELNIYYVSSSPKVGGPEVERRYLELVRSVRQTIGIPLAVKLSPYFSSVANLTRQLVQAGADGLVLFNRFYQPDLDLETLEVTPRLELSTSEELRLPLRWIAILHKQVPASLAASTGVHTAADVVKVLLAGADVAMMTSALLRHGPDHVQTVEEELRAVMAERDYDSVAQLRGSMSRAAMADPADFERANYMRTLMSWSSHAQVSPGQATSDDPVP